MRIGIVGGLDRSEALYTRMAEDAGHQVAFHNGGVGGRGGRSLEQMIDHCDVLLIVTDINSHSGVQMARRLARERGCAPVLMRRCGVSRFSAILKGDISQRSA